ncbi:hypothetical protein [Candidatus Venteria ishoeyi]|uniref:Glycogen synthase n=1 Tax=Candidatus Venteria ishoeyi TaxID=1899563 RepID=A0A1H6F7R2_9GAMM|nr:hypothetical protein [Candidatus Venteria ishoeyi]SEH05096.1 glycogen synthase [Candidatus Venteria ishoeyi]
MKEPLLLSQDVHRIYSSKSLKKKFSEKENLQKQYGLTVGKKIFCLGMTLSISQKNKANLLVEIIEGLLEIGFQLVFLSSAEEEFQKPIE